MEISRRRLSSHDQTSHNDKKDGDNHNNAIYLSNSGDISSDLNTSITNERSSAA